MATTHRTLVLAALLAGHLPGAGASDSQDWGQLRRQATEYLIDAFTREYPDVRAEAIIGGVDTRLKFRHCPHPTFLPADGGRPRTSGSLGVQCDQPSEWRLYLSYQMKLSGPALVLRRPMTAGSTPTAGDVELKDIPYEQDPGLYPRDVGRLRDTLLARSLPAGSALRVDLLKRPPSIRAGQRVRVILQGEGFQVGNEGIAQGTARAGDRVKVKLLNGQRLEGTANEDGTVGIHP